MAKKITDTDSPAIETQDLSPETTEQPPQVDPAPQAELQTPAPKAEKQVREEKPAETIPEYADRILQSFPGYKELYIDIHGGAFTVDTPPALRGQATRYTNPYYSKPQKP